MAWVARVPPTARGMALLVIATLSFAGMQSCVRLVSHDLHPFEIGFFRSLFGLLVFIPFLIRVGLEPLRTRRIGLQVLRGTLHVISMLTFFLAISFTPLSKAVALDFSAPLFATAMAPFILGERLRVRRVLALVVGFSGVLVVLRPGMVQLDLGAVLVLVSALCWGTAILVVKMMARVESSLTISIYMVLISTPMSLLAAIPFWQTPTGVHLAWLVATGTFGSIGHWCIAQAMREAEMTAILPLDFLRMVWMSLAGYVFFGEVPDLWTWVGAAIIFSSATYIAIRESGLRGQRLREARIETAAGGKLELTDRGVT